MYTHQFVNILSNGACTPTALTDLGQNQKNYAQYAHLRTGFFTLSNQTKTAHVEARIPRRSSQGEKLMHHAHSQFFDPSLLRRHCIKSRINNAHRVSILAVIHSRERGVDHTHKNTSRNVCAHRFISRRIQSTLGTEIHEPSAQQGPADKPRVRGRDARTPRNCTMRSTCIKEPGPDRRVFEIPPTGVVSERSRETTPNSNLSFQTAFSKHNPNQHILRRLTSQAHIRKILG